MSIITFANGLRIFTPSKPPVPEGTSSVLRDMNGDGLVDILDVAILLNEPAPPGGVITTPPPTITPSTDPFDNTKTCPEGETLTIIPIGNGLTTTGCSSIPSRPPLPPVPTEESEPWFCPGNKIRGFGLDYENPFQTVGYPVIYYGECTCAEASVNLAEIAAIIGTGGYAATRSLMKKRIVESIAQAQKSKDLWVAWQKAANLDLENLIKEVGEFDDMLDTIGRELRDLRESMTYNPNPDTYRMIKELEIDLRNKTDEKARAILEKTDIEYNLTNADAQVNRNIELINSGLKALENILNATDPTALATIMLGSLLPINFIVPKECGAFSMLDENCNCVPISSGSYSYSSKNQDFSQSGYNIIQSL